MTPYETEFACRFAERKKRQLNDGPCAAVIVDCDCDACIHNSVKHDLRHWNWDGPSVRITESEKDGAQ